MPTYDYKCNACNHRFELFQSMKDSPKRKCPKCAKNALERLIGTGAAIIFKGSGFYETDYRSESYKKAADAEKAPAASDAKSETKSDTKPDSKPDTKSESRKSESKSDPKPSSAKINKPAPSKPVSSKSASKSTSKLSKRRSPSK